MKKINNLVNGYKLSVFSVRYREGVIALIAPREYIEQIEDCLDLRGGEGGISAFNSLSVLLYPFFAIGDNVFEALAELNKNLKDIDDIYDNFNLDYKDVLDELRIYLNNDEHTLNESLWFLSECRALDAKYANENLLKVEEIYLAAHEKRGVVVVDDFIPFLKKMLTNRN